MLSKNKKKRKQSQTKATPIMMLLTK